VYVKFSDIASGFRIVALFVIVDICHLLQCHAVSVGIFMTYVHIKLYVLATVVR